jgi:hypothetical protein
MSSSNSWINHVKHFSQKNNMSYTQALKSSQCKASYKKQTGKGVRFSSQRVNPVPQNLIPEERMVRYICDYLDNLPAFNVGVFDTLPRAENRRQFISHFILIILNQRRLPASHIDYYDVDDIYDEVRRHQTMLVSQLSSSTQRSGFSNGTERLTDNG